MTSPASTLGLRLGILLRQWLSSEPEQMTSGRVIANRLIDALGADDSLRGPIRDLCGRPQLLQALCGDGASRAAAALDLSQQLAQTYAPAVLSQLIDLLEAASGVALPRAAALNLPAAPAAALAGHAPRGQMGWRPLLAAIGPGIALAASASLVFSWLAQELDRALFDRWGWSGGVVLVLGLAALQALMLGPLRGWRRLWSLNDQQAIQPRQAWRWIGASWLHANAMEAAFNLVLLLILLGNSPLPLAEMVLRFGLTALFGLVPSVLLAQRWNVPRRWSGAAAPISALIALAAGLSLLHWRVHRFETPLFSIPAWVLVLVFGALQLSWILPRRASDSSSRPWQRVLCSPWCWGALLGLSWALISRVRELL